MPRRRPRPIVSLLLALALACDPEAAPTPPRAPPPPPPAAPDPPRVPALPDAPVVAAPSPQTEGAITVTATRCDLDGPPLAYQTFANPGVVQTTRGDAVYLVDGERALRRYRVASGRDCRLTLDAGFGDGGRLDLEFPDGLGGSVEGVAIDGRGDVYVGSAMSGSVRVRDGSITRCEASRGRVVVPRDGRFGIAYFVSTFSRVTFTDDGCLVVPFVYRDAYERTESFSFAGDQLYVAGAGAPGHFQVQPYDDDGAPAGARWGSAERDAADLLCTPANVVLGTRGPVVLDASCRALVVRGDEGETLARIDAAALIGLPAPSLGTLAPARDGVTYLLASQERAPRSRHFDGYVFRVDGL